MKGDEACCCGTSLEEQSKVILMFSLMGNGASAYCKRCRGILRSGINDKEDVPNWIKSAYRRFWDELDPETI